MVVFTRSSLVEWPGLTFGVLGVGAEKILGFFSRSNFNLHLHQLHPGKGDEPNIYYLYTHEMMKRKNIQFRDTMNLYVNWKGAR